MALMALSTAQCSWYSIVITAGCVRPYSSERDFANSGWKASYFGGLASGGGETVGWLSNSMIYDRHARLPHKTHIVGFNLDLNHQPLPVDSAEWRRMMRWHRPRTDTHRQNPPRCAQDLSDLVTHLSVVFVHQVLWRSTQSMYPDSLFFCKLHIYTNDCTFIFYVMKSETDAKQGEVPLNSVIFFDVPEFRSHVLTPWLPVLCNIQSRSVLVFLKWAIWGWGGLTHWCLSSACSSCSLRPVLCDRTVWLLSLHNHGKEQFQDEAKHLLYAFF